MRINHPVTQREFPIGDDMTLMSTTDTKGRITYANAAFCAISGYEFEELVGKPHNLIRHPDMPPEAFADMWATLQAGQTWTAVVKNRRKDGDHYWVRANAAPLRRNGRLVGYMSVRTKPSAAEVQGASALYQALREGRARSIRIHKGLVVRSGAWAWTSLIKTLSVRGRIRLGMSGGWLASVGAIAATGVTGTALGSVAAISASAALLSCLWLERQIAAPLAVVLGQALDVAAGQAPDAASPGRVDEIGMVQRCLDQAALNLRSLVDDVSDQISGLRTASSEIAAGNLDLSARTEQTASSLQETAASMEQLHGTAGNSSNAAKRAAELANTASSAASRGGEEVNEVIDTMEAIKVSSRKISDIITVIDGIAFQTNILALNAAVEAARASEQGRGFAVVAGEVRNLAQRSAQAAHEIKALISASVERVDAGAMVVTRAGETMASIVTQVGRVDQLIAEIERAATEQTLGVGQVNTAITQLDQATQQNAALVEESAAAAQSLAERANRLADAVQVFSASTTLA